MTIFLQLIQLIHTINKHTIQDTLLQARMSMFQTVCSAPLHHQVTVVRCIALQRHIFLLSQLLYSLAKQAAVMEEPFTSKMKAVNK
jgi:hypothetical protein